MRQQLKMQAGSIASPMSIEEVKAMLDTTEKGGVRNSIKNCLTVFQHDPLLSGAIAYNLLFLLGAIHRAFHPGCKFEVMLCLVGGQGAGKSTFFRLLAGKDEWFSDDLRKLDDENVYKALLNCRASKLKQN